MFSLACMCGTFFDTKPKPWRLTSFNYGLVIVRIDPSCSQQCLTFDQFVWHRCPAPTHDVNICNWIAHEAARKNLARRHCKTHDHRAENKGWWHPPDGKYGPHSFIQQQPPWTQLARKIPEGSLSLKALGIRRSFSHHFSSITIFQTSSHPEQDSYQDYMDAKTQRLTNINKSWFNTRAQPWQKLWTLWTILCHKTWVQPESKPDQTHQNTCELQTSLSPKYWNAPHWMVQSRLLQPAFRTWMTIVWLHAAFCISVKTSLSDPNRPEPNKHDQTGTTYANIS